MRHYCLLDAHSLVSFANDPLPLTDVLLEARSVADGDYDRFRLCTLTNTKSRGRGRTGHLVATFSIFGCLFRVDEEFQLTSAFSYSAVNWFLPRDALQSAVLLSHVVRPSVRLSVRL